MQVTSSLNGKDERNWTSCCATHTPTQTGHRARGPYITSEQVNGRPAGPARQTARALLTKVHTQKTAGVCVCVCAPAHRCQAGLLRASCLRSVSRFLRARAGHGANGWPVMFLATGSGEASCLARGQNFPKSFPMPGKSPSGQTCSNQTWDFALLTTFEQKTKILSCCCPGKPTINAKSGASTKNETHTHTHTASQTGQCRGCSDHFT